MDDKTNTITYWSSMYDPMTGKDQKVKTVMKEKDENNCSFEMYVVENGQETKNMQIDYTRVK